MRQLNHTMKYILTALFICFPLFANSAEHEEGDFDVKKLILDHVADAYDWHILTLDNKHISIPLPIIVKGQESGWHVFLSSRFHHGHETYNGFYIAQEGKYDGKIVESVGNEEVRPWDFSITKNAASLILSSIVIVILILHCAQYYRKRKNNPEKVSPSGFIAFVELTIMSVVDGVIKPCIGKNYKRYTPYLLTVFFFIIFDNFLGLIPIFPGGANVTGNIAVTVVLALFTFVIVNIYGTKEYWREIFWPDVPIWLKAVPIMPAIELVGVFTKPFALMIRLFANILAGHAMVLGLICVIFLTVKLGPAMNAGMTLLSVIMTIFIDCVELLVAYIQAYVFTMLSAVFIGLSQVEPHHVKN
jgi:F0F1-type ATP synthase, subunit a